MLSQTRKTTQSSTESGRTDSARGGPTSNLNRTVSHQSSISEELNNDKLPSPPPLPSPKRSVSKSASSSASSSPTQSTSKPTTNGIKDRKTTSDKPSQRSALRRIHSDEQNNGTRRNPVTTFNSKRTTPPNHNRVSARDIENEKSTSPLGKGNQSIFEKVDKHSGRTSYLGTGTFTQLEDCIRNCLARNKQHIDITHHSTKYDFPHHSSKYDFPHKSLTRASVLEDYSYEGITAPKHHITHSDHDHHYSDHDHHYSDHHHHYSDHHDHHYSDHHHHHSDHHTKSAASLSLEEIHQVNDALARYGIPVFSGHDHHYDMYNKPQSVGELLSACQRLMQDPTIASLRTGPQAVQHVWDNLQHHQPNYAVQHVWDHLQHQQPQSSGHGYASPAMRGVASHLFNPSQPPYNPVNSVTSHLFGQPPQNSYNPGQSAISNLFGQPSQPPQPPPNLGQSAISRLFGQPSQPPQPPPNPGQSALSRLFGPPSSNPPQGAQNFQSSPFSNSFNQYPGNPNYPY